MTVNMKKVEREVACVLSRVAEQVGSPPYIKAIKLCRDLTGKSLIESKEYVDSVKAKMAGKSLDGFGPQEFWFLAWKGKPGKRGLITTLCASTRTHLIQKAEATEGMAWSAIRRRGGIATKCEVSWMLP